MSTAPVEPTPSPLPNHPLRSSSLAPPRSDAEKEESRSTEESTDQHASTRPHPKPTFPSPKLRLECRDLTHDGAQIFFQYNQPATALFSAVETVLSTLYHFTRSNPRIPHTRSVTLILRAMPGVAYTTSTDLDSDHKEIHLSLDYIKGIASGREAEEIQGVLVHEMVHCWQWNALGTAPGGLIEGIADFVRLTAGLSPPHWKREGGGEWDAGYQHTAYFLEWLEGKWGDGSVQKINDKLRKDGYKEPLFWGELFGKTVGELWEEYQASRQKRKGDAQEDKEMNGSFWEFVGKKKGVERAVVMKAIWITRTHVKQGTAKEGLAGEVERLWLEYLGGLDDGNERSAGENSVV